MKSIRLFLLVFASMLSMGFSCLPRVYTPPTRVWLDETSPMPLEKEGNAISLTGGMAGGGEVLGGTWYGGGGGLTYRRGLVDWMEGEVNLSYLRIDPTKDYTLNIEPQAFSMRTALKISPPRISRFFSARAGVGLGTTGAGQYAGLDLGIIAGWHNPYVVPFVNGGGYVSFPFNAKPVVFFSSSSGSSPASTDTLETTYGVEAGTGFMVYVLYNGNFRWRNRGEEPKTPGKMSLGIYASGKITLLRAEHHDTEWPVSGGLGAEVEF